MGPRSTGIAIRRIRETDRAAVEKILLRRWGPPGVVTRGRMHPAHTYPGYLAWSGGRIIGLVTYRIERGRCEVITLDALRKRVGIGSRLLAATEREARRAGCREAWLITTNDNLPALRFYQRRGWRIRRVHCRAIEHSRSLKPSIPRIGRHRIPLCDEIELSKSLTAVRSGRR
jgi:ribosomal protein S18 acetylase RimI-like enzyme